MNRFSVRPTVPCPLAVLTINRNVVDCVGRAVALLEVGHVEVRELLRYAERARESAVQVVRELVPPTAADALATKPSVPCPETANSPTKLNFFVSYTKSDEHWAD